MCHLSLGQVSMDRSLPEFCCSHCAYQDHQATLSLTPDTQQQFVWCAASSLSTPLGPVGLLLHCAPAGVCRAQLSLLGAPWFLCMSAGSSWLAQIGAAFAGWRCCSLTHRHWAGRKVLNTHICSSALCPHFLELGWMSSCLKHTQLSLSSLSIPAEGATRVFGIYMYA